MNHSYTMEQIELHYLTSRAMMIDEIEGSHGLIIRNQSETHLEVDDTCYNRHLIFRNVDQPLPAEILAGNLDGIDGERLLAIAQTLNPALFMTIRQIVMIGNRQDYAALVAKGWEMMPSYHRCLGQYRVYDGTILMNLHAMRLMVNGMIFAGEVNKADRRTALTKVFWQTLLHELRHGHQTNPLVEDVFSDYDLDALDSDAESYAERVWGELLATNDLDMWQRPGKRT